MLGSLWRFGFINFKLGPVSTEHSVYRAAPQQLFGAGLMAPRFLVYAASVCLQPSHGGTPQSQLDGWYLSPAIFGPRFHIAHRSPAKT